MTDTKKYAYIFLANLIEVFADFFQRVLEQVGFGGRPVLHFVLAYVRALRSDQAQTGFADVIIVFVQRIHGMKL